MKTVLVTGANGQVGQEFRLLSEYSTSYKFLFAGRSELELADVIPQSIKLSQISANVWQLM
jgi:dTDP-4-dehydrorhamnose reductase